MMKNTSNLETTTNDAATSEFQKSGDIEESTNKVKDKSKEQYNEPFNLLPIRPESNDHSSLSSSEMTYI
jgi:hypothetical protein